MRRGYSAANNSVRQACCPNEPTKGSERSRRGAPLRSQQVDLQLLVSVFARPDIERQRRKFVDDWNG